MRSIGLALLGCGLLLALHCFCSCNGVSVKNFLERDTGFGNSFNEVDSDRFGSDSMSKVDLGRRWNTFKRVFNKTYESSAHEAERMRIFVENQMKILKHNAQAMNGMHTFTMGMNQFGDMTHEEFVKTMNGFMKNYAETRGHEASNFLSPLNAHVPDSVDWRTQGYVTPVKNQGHCGSCWSFSSTGALEGQHFRKTGQLVSLSEQNLIDCSTAFGNEGCNGGLMDNAFKYIKANKGVDTETSYPYEAKDDKCHFKRSDVGADDTGFVDVPTGDEDQLKQAVGTVGPVSIAIDASHESFQFYKKGVYHEPDCSSTELDHGVLVVGYGTNDQGEDFWIVKNSWAATWGDQGYIYMARNQQNQCGVATAASYPLV